MLDEKDFENLTKGEVIEKDGVKIALQDIGYDNMMDILHEHIKKFYDEE
jgi:hypothetical protein